MGPRMLQGSTVNGCFKWLMVDNPMTCCASEKTLCSLYHSIGILGQLTMDHLKHPIALGEASYGLWTVDRGPFNQSTSNQ